MRSSGWRECVELVDELRVYVEYGLVEAHIEIFQEAVGGFSRLEGFFMEGSSVGALCGSTPAAAE